MYYSGVFEPPGIKELDSVNTVRKFQTDPKFTPRRATKPNLRNSMIAQSVKIYPQIHYMISLITLLHLLVSPKLNGPEYSICKSSNVPVKVLFKDHLFLNTSNDSDSRSDGGVRHQFNPTQRTATVE